MRDSLPLSCLHILFKIQGFTTLVFLLDKEKYELEIPKQMICLIKFVMNSNFFLTSKKDSQDMKNPIQDPLEIEQRNNKLAIFCRDHEVLMR